MVIIRPLSTPTSNPANKPPTTAKGTGMPSTRSMALTRPEKPITDPTERSIPAVMMTIASPNAAIAIQEKARRMLKMFVDVRNVSVYRVRKAISASRIKATPNSWRPNRPRRLSPRDCGWVSAVCAVMLPLLQKMKSQHESSICMNSQYFSVYFRSLRSHHWHKP